MPAVRHKGIMLLFQYPEFGRRWIGSVVSGLGNQVGWIALIWLVMQLSGHAAALGVVTLLYQLPQALFAPIAGVVLDRYPRGRVMAIANFILGLIFAAIPIVASSFGTHGLWMIYLLIAISGVILPFDTTGLGPLVADLIPKEHLSAANFLSQTVWQIAYLAGPGLGGVLIEWVGSKPLLFVNAVTFVFLGLLMLSVNSSGHQKNQPSTSPWNNIREGVAYLVKSPPLLALAVLSLFFNFFYGPYEVLLPALSKSNLGGAAALGFLWFAFALGALGGGLIFSTRSWKFRLSLSLAMIVVLWGVVTVLLAYVTQHFWLASLCMFLGGLEFSPWGALVTTARQRIVPPQLHGRVFGTSALFAAAGTPVGAWLTGLLLPYTNPYILFLISGIVTVVIGVASVFSSALRGVDVPTHDA